MSFRDDGYAAVDWAASYLDRVAELPVLAQVEPGELSARLPSSPPESGEPFANVLRDLDELLVPALTNWQHPRFFAYFAVTASEPGILAELLAATMNQVAILWRASPASTELELRVVDWVRQLLGLPDGWHGHIEDTASTSTLAAIIAARHVTGRNVVVCSEHAHSSVEKAARMLGMELRKAPVDEELRMRPDCRSPTSRQSSRPSARRRSPRSTLSASSRTARTPRARGSTSTPPTPGHHGSARRSGGRRMASSSRTRSSSTRTNG